MKKIIYRYKETGTISHDQDYDEYIKRGKSVEEIAELMAIFNANKELNQKAEIIELDDKDTLEEASAMLKELEQNAAECDDNADAIIYGLRSITGALKAGNNPDER